MKLEIDLEKLTENGIDAHLYCILYNVYYKNSRILLSYLNSVGKPSKSMFQKLSDEGFIEPLGGDKPTLENLKLTEKFTNLFVTKGTQKEFNKLFEELVAEYPVKVGNRRLITEKDNCKSLYKKIIISNNQINYELHNKIIKALKKEKQERYMENSSQFMVQMVRYIRNKMWETYMDDNDEDLEIRTFKKIV